MKTEKILVLGATGNIGQPLIEQLQKQNRVVVAGVRKPHPALQAQGVECRTFDFLQPATFETALAGIAKVFFVRPPQLADPKQDMYPFLAAVKAHQIEQLVFVSLLGVEKNPMTPHHKIEKKIEALAIPATFIRPSFFMQNLNTTHRFDLKERHDLFIPAGNAKTSFIDTRDIAAVAATCLTDPSYLGKKLVITGAEALTYQKVSQIMSDILPFTVTYSRPSLLKFRRVMLQRGIEKEYVNVMVMLYLITQLGNAKTVTSTVKDVLGREPIAFAQYVKDYQTDFCE